MKPYESVGMILRQKGSRVYDITPDLTICEALEIMTCPPVTVNMRATINECMRLITETRCRHLVVVVPG